jgi:hypothetical protein
MWTVHKFLQNILPLGMMWVELYRSDRVLKGLARSSSATKNLYIFQLIAVTEHRDRGSMYMSVHMYKYIHM